MSDSSWPHGLLQARLPCPSPTPGAYSNSCPSSQWCHPNLASSAVPFSLPSIFPSIRVFSNESVLRIRLPKFWSFIFSINPSNEYSGLILFRMDCLDLLAVQGTLKIFSNTKWADYLKRDQVQLFQGRLSGLNDYLKMRNKGVDSQVWFQDSILEEKILVCTINEIRKIREVKGREEISS